MEEDRWGEERTKRTAGAGVVLSRQDGGVGGLHVRTDTAYPRSVDVDVCRDVRERVGGPADSDAEAAWAAEIERRVVAIEARDG